jgi:hypothetical protein
MKSGEVSEFEKGEFQSESSSKKSKSHQKG